MRLVSGEPHDRTPRTPETQPCGEISGWRRRLISDAAPSGHLWKNSSSLTWAQRQWVLTAQERGTAGLHMLQRTRVSGSRPFSLLDSLLPEFSLLQANQRPDTSQLP